jgi:ankyrin repeat protein
MFSASIKYWSFTLGHSALHAVCTTHSRDDYEGDRVDIAELLINKKCGVYDLDDAGQSTLHAACNLSNPGIVKLLLVLLFLFRTNSAISA